MTEIRIPFSDEQADAWIDACLYGTSYGYQTGEHEYIEAAMAKLGHAKGTYTTELENHNMEHVCRLAE